MQEETKKQQNEALKEDRESCFRRFWRLIRPAIFRFFMIPFGKVLRFCRRYVAVLCLLLCVALALGSFALIISGAVCNKTRDRIVTPEELLAQGEAVDCILVLGCMVYSDGRLSHMLSDRVKTAVGLYHAGLSDRLLMSGDHHKVAYNEVDPMRNAAIAQGVPESAIEIDPWGLSTYDSIARIAEEYRGRRVVIVTQRYHLFRALYIAEKLGIDAHGVSADMRIYSKRIWWEAREVLARCKDVYYVEKRPVAAGITE